MMREIIQKTRENVRTCVCTWIVLHKYLYSDYTLNFFEESIFSKRCDATYMHCVAFLKRHLKKILFCDRCNFICLRWHYDTYITRLENDQHLHRLICLEGHI